jgi:hypothetical protein
MDPLQAIAARQVSLARKSEADEIDAFYDAHALEGLHNARRALMHLVRLLRDARSRLGRKAPTAPEIASGAGRA